MAVEVVKGWKVFFHPAMLDQLEALIAQVQKARTKDPVGYVKKASAKRLAAIGRLIFDVIPDDPAHANYRQGGTLGPEYKHWRRASFYQQYRLYFRYSESQRVLIYAWVNDDQTLRAYESDMDAYRVFRRMLQAGNPPDDWDALVAACGDAPTQARANQVLGDVRDPEPGGT